MSRLEELANSLFGEMRDMTPEESKSISDYISSISEPTGVNIWDLIEDNNTNTTTNNNKIIYIDYPYNQINKVEYINDNCRYCHNHPSNGGSGICHCILGMPKITY